MKITDSIYLVGSGRDGFSISHRVDCHVYLLEGADEHILIDAGIGLDAVRIIENIEHENIDPVAVRHLILTHTHSDHSGGAAYLREQLGLPVHVPLVEAELLRTGDGDALGLRQAIADGIYPPDYTFIPCDASHTIKDGDLIEAGGISIQAIHTPGHSPGATSSLVKIGGRMCLFSGDTVFHNGRLAFLNCPGSVMADYRASLPKLADLSIDSLFPGPGCIVMERGQSHIDQAISALAHVRPPMNFR